MTRWLPRPENLSSEKDAGQKVKVNSVSCSGYSFSVLILKTAPHPLLTFLQTFHSSPSVCPHSPLSFLASRNTAQMAAARTRTETSTASTTIQVQELGNKPSAKQDTLSGSLDHMSFWGHCQEGPSFPLRAPLLVIRGNRDPEENPAALRLQRYGDTEDLY